MRLRKKNVSRVAAVAVAAVMAVSAAAPAAFAAAPVATNNVAVEAATDTAQKELTVYYQLEDGTTLGQTDTLTVGADEEFEYPATHIPEGYEAIGDLTYKANYLTDSLYIPVRKIAVAPASKTLTVYYQLEDGTNLGQTDSISVDADGKFEYPATSIPEGYEAIGDLTYNATYLTDSLYIPVRKTATTKVVKINFYSEDEKKQIAEPRLIVAANATSVNSSELTAPKGYELCESGDFAIRDGYVYVAVRKVATKTVKINFYSEDEEKQIEESELTVAADATSVNSSKLTAPKGYELCEVGDFAIRDGYVYAAVRKATTKVVKINFYSEDEEKQIAEPELTVAADATSVNSSALTAPEGYELCEVGDFAIRDGYVYVAVRKVTTPDPVDPTPTPDPEPTPAPTVNPVTTALGVGAWLLALGGLILGFFGL